MSNLIIFATYWNEIEWIEASLDQIEKLNPIEIIICDGNFDSSVPNYSTDGTREIIEKFVERNSHRAKMISAIRYPSYLKGIAFYCKCGQSIFNVGRLFQALKFQLKMDSYRVNQALTFAKMMHLAEKWHLGRWVMSYDADQFYTDSLIEDFLKLDEDTEFELVTADEWTFPASFHEYSEDYEKRKWNNMPHKIVKNMAVYPTRHFVKEAMFSAKHIYEYAKRFHAGVYHHYKFRRDLTRLEAGYSLGDRVAPSKERFKNMKPISTDNLPNVILRNYNV